MSNSGSLIARNPRIITDEVGSSTPLILAVLQENHTSNLSEREIPKTARRGAKVGSPTCPLRYGFALRGTPYETKTAERHYGSDWSGERVGRRAKALHAGLHTRGPDPLAAPQGTRIT